MSHDGKKGSGGRRDRALRQLAAAQRREAEANESIARFLESAAKASGYLADALEQASLASAALSRTMQDDAEAARTLRQSELLGSQSGYARNDAGFGRSRANLLRAQARRALSQADTNESFRVVKPPKGRAVRRGV